MTQSPFAEHSGGLSQGPLTKIRRSMLLKKRLARTATALPAISSPKSNPIKSASAKPKPLDSALRKLKKAARHYDRYRDGEVLTKSFADYKMESVEFRMQMRRAMGVNLNKREAEDLLNHADRDKSGTLDGAEFLLMFFKEAHGEHAADVRSRLKLKQERLKLEKQRIADTERNEAEKDAKSFTTNFTERDTKRVLKCLAKHAANFDGMSEAGKRTCANFGCVLRPSALKEQLLKSFNMKVTKAELGALIAQFDRDGDGDVSGAEFMVSLVDLV